MSPDLVGADDESALFVSGTCILCAVILHSHAFMERGMRIGVVFPQTEIGTDPVAIRDYAQAVDEMGYRHILVYDHVIGASTANRPDWRGAYTIESQFHEPFVLYGYLAAITRRVELVT